MGCCASLDAAAAAPGSFTTVYADHVGRGSARRHRPLPPADVLEIIAEYACGTVADVCALRATARGYRRALDTTVRRLVSLDQPEVRATLHIHSGTAHLDAVRIALTCNRFKSIARLVVVAFALDGAKDELREGDVCGPRPVECNERLPTDGQSDTFAVLRSHWLVSWKAPPTAARTQWLLQCVSNVQLTAPLMTDALCEAVARRAIFGHVTHLALCHGSPLALRRLAKIICVIGPQLTHLVIRVYKGVEPATCDTLRHCSRLKYLTIAPLRFMLRDSSRALCDALLAAKAPLEYVSVCFTADDALRLLAGLPTIVAAQIPSITFRAFLPAGVGARLSSLNADGTVPTRAHTPVTPQELISAAADESSDSALSHAELDTLPPGFDIDELRLPSSLVGLATTDAVAFGRGLLAHLGAQFDGLPNLEELVIRASMVAPRAVNISPLAAFAGRLRVLELPDITINTAAAEATLARLTGLREVVVPGLNSPRCFLGRQHTYLRKVHIGRIHDPASGATFFRFAAACPCLMWARGVDPAPIILPKGWSVTAARTTVARLSFT